MITSKGDENLHPNDPRGQPSQEGAVSPDSPTHVNGPTLTPNSSGQTIHQRRRPLSLLLSPPSTSPLAPLNGSNRSSLSRLPREHYQPQQPHNTTQAHDASSNHTNGALAVYDPNRGAQLRRQAELANPYRDRRERSHCIHEQQRARSRSPRRMIQSSGFVGYQEPPRTQRAGMNSFPREVYVPPRPNNRQPQYLPSPSSVQASYYTPSGHGHGIGHPRTSPGETDHPNDYRLYDNRQAQHPEQVHESPIERHTARRKQDANQLDEDHLCEFAAPCRMHPSPDGMHYRKVVSHVFGRNKAVTKLFPLGVWVHYCRKHYQRARYRADQWPFTQCDLLLESLNRMESWDGVESFELILRRREQMRVGRESDPAATPGVSNENSSVNQAQGQDTRSQSVVTRPQGRKHPTAIIAPVPDWLRQHVGHDKTFAEVRYIIEMVRSHMVKLRNVERAQQIKDTPKTQCGPDNSRRGASSNTRKARNAKPGSQDPMRARTSKIRFPDVEILPHFKPWVKKAALRQRSATASSLKDDDSKVSEQSAPGERQALAEVRDSGNATSQAEPSHRADVEVFRSHLASSHPNQRLQPGSTTETGRALLSEPEAHIGRAGTNRGLSESQRRRSERVYIKALDCVSRPGSVKKPGKDGEK